VTLTSGTTLAAAVAQLNADAGFTGAGLSAAQGTGANANKLVITGPTGVTNTLDLTGTTLSDTTPAGAAAGAGVDFTAASVSTLSAGSAQQVLTSLTTAIQNVAYQRGSIGANINQLNAASNVASSESVNLTAAENSVRATNYGQATSDMAKFKVLSQTGIAALSQANSVQQDVLKLLQ
jgi:flagellin